MFLSSTTLQRKLVAQVPGAAHYILHEAIDPESLRHRNETL